MNLIKVIFKTFGIEFVVKKLLSYGLTALLKDDPYVFTRIKKPYEKQFIDNLLTSIPHIGYGVNINGIIKVSDPKGLTIGNNVHIGEGCFFNSRGGITILDNAHLSRNITIYSSNHNYNGKLLPFDLGYTDKPVVIEENVWIGMNVNILPGVRIGSGAIIGMGTTVAADVKPREIVGSQKFRMIKQRDESHYLALAKSNNFSGKNGSHLSNKELNSYYKSLDTENCQPFFIVSTGRSGSTTIAKILNKHPEVECLHEPKLQLVRLSTDFLHGKISKEVAKQELIDLYIRLGSTIMPLYGESDQKLSNLITLITEILPKAKFIWLIRNAKDTINSTWSRGWFDDAELGINDKLPSDYILYRGIYSDYRPQANLANNLSTDEWESMTSFARNCWYWTFWNHIIGEQLSIIDKNKYIKVRLENLDQDLPKIATFLRLKEFNFTNMVANQAEPRYTLKSDDDWTSNMQTDFKKYCNLDLYNEG